MTTSVSLFIVRCLTTNTWQTTYRETNDPPTTCPVDTAHTIDPALTAVVRTITDEVTTVAEPTEGDFQTRTVDIVIPAGAVGDVTSTDISFPYDLLLWNTAFNTTAAHTGDVFSCIGGPNTTVGVLSVAAAIGATVLDVSLGTLVFIREGYDIRLDDTVTQENVGVATNLDDTLNQLTVENALVNAFAVGTQVQINIRACSDYEISYEGKHSFGRKGFRGKKVPKGTVFRIDYTNNDGLAKNIVWVLEYYLQS